MNKQLIYKFFSGKTTDEESIRVLDWMEASEENKQVFFRERKLYDAIQLSDEEVWEEVTTKKNQWIPWIKKYGQIAAILVLGVSLSYLYWQYDRQQASLQAINTITVPAGQRVNLTLGDGTNVWLNARTTFKYPAFFSKGNREVSIDGEAYFNVTKDAKRPFIVNTGKYEVEVLGTSFNIQAYSENERFETALMNGRVKVTSNENHQTVTLFPSQMATDNNGTLQVIAIPDYDVFRWKEGLICFKAQPFNQIMYEFEKTYGIRIEVRNNKVSQYVYTGKFRQSDGIDHALRVLQKSIYFTFDRNEENDIVYIN